MNTFIEAVNRLQDIVSGSDVSLDLTLPQIAVVGSQSSGKSSVLEHIVGEEFLPRGPTMVTRCPIVLQLHQLPKNDKRKWGEFLHLPNKRFTDFNLIREEILRYTRELIGDRTVTSQSITLKISSAAVANLTLVDLPGLVTTPIRGQPETIVTDIEDMVRRYVADKNTVILAITPANQDVATSAALSVSRMVDPHGERTMGVLTKLDLMDRGTTAHRTLMGDEYELKFGFIGVVNRSQESINSGQTMSDARAAEEEFINEYYPELSGRMGTKYLTAVLNSVLVSRIKECLPFIRQQISDKVNDASVVLKELGPRMPPEDGPEKTKYVRDLLQRFELCVTSEIEGRMALATPGLKAGARIGAVVRHRYWTEVADLEVSDKVEDQFLRETYHSTSGVYQPHLHGDAAIRPICATCLIEMERPSANCVREVKGVLKDVAMKALESLRFPLLQHSTMEEVDRFYDQQTEACLRAIDSLFEREKSFINISHPLMECTLPELRLIVQGMRQSFSRSRPAGARQALQQSPLQQYYAQLHFQQFTQQQQYEQAQKQPAQGDKSVQENQPQERRAAASEPTPADPTAPSVSLNAQRGGRTMDERNIEIVKDSILKYFEISKLTLGDQVHKLINFYLVYEVCRNLRNVLMDFLTEEVISTVSEPEERARMRKEFNSKLDRLLMCRRALDDFATDLI
ncbi:dynamin GTPase [Angomonas deanei]|nr:dynamin GTPase [Angomonas deanei]|eukprot:EPY24358.1 dynamin GTPase [Angomonas deanei]